jgi:hypothetical protein
MKETSPVFHQFLDAVYQLLYTNPQRFEFNERFLRRLLYHAYSCQYGSFLYDSERERIEAKVRKRTRCVWDYFLARRKEFLNAEFDPSLDIGEGVLFPKSESVRWWATAWGRTDAEMNGPGRGTNVRDEVAKTKEKSVKEGRDRDEILRERLERVVRTTSPKKEHLQLFEGVGSSPARTRATTLTEIAIERPSSRQKEVILATTEAADCPAEESPLAEDEEVKKVAVIESDDSLAASADLVSSNVEESESSSGYATDTLALELDPLGGGVEMSSLALNSTSLRNR